MYQYCSENSFPATLGTMPRVMRLEHATLAENEIAEDNLSGIQDTFCLQTSFFSFFSPQGLKSLALDRVLDIHKLFTAGTNKRK